MDFNLDDIDLAVVVNIEILREVLGKLSVNGRRWWIACEPEYALERGSLTVGHGCPGCSDRLNTVLYRVPVLNTDRPVGGADKLVVLLDAGVITPEQPGLYREGNKVVEDAIADMEEFFIPICRALVPLLAESCGLDRSRWADGVTSKKRI
jgi:hypothetical protein